MAGSMQFFATFNATKTSLRNLAISIVVTSSKIAIFAIKENAEITNNNLMTLISYYKVTKIFKRIKITSKTLNIR